MQRAQRGGDDLPTVGAAVECVYGGEVGLNVYKCVRLVRRARLDAPAAEKVAVDAITDENGAGR